ncbi:MAG: RagB/SusD family nutrient uptake outer membrane protein [Balneolales bacterium]
MKNHRIEFGIAFLAILFFNGCNDDFLTRTPLDEISNESFWKTENDLRTYNNELYDMTLDELDIPILMGHPEGAGGSLWRGSVWWQDGFTDNLAPRHARHNRFQQVRAGRHSIPSGTEEFGYRGWDFVRAINVGLQNYNKSNLPEAVANRYAGEARLFRGLFYAEKVTKFGDVPWVDRELNIDSEELYAGRTPREEAMDNVLADLDFATDNLPADWGDGNEPGRLNRWDALLIKSRVALFEGTWRKYHGGSNAEMWLQVAADAAKEVMDDGPHSIYNTGDPENDYNAIHRMADLSGNPEVMYWRKYELGVVTNTALTDYFHYTGGATKSFVEDYLDINGLPITDPGSVYQGDDTIEDVFENRDPRLRQTILHPGDTDKYSYHNNDGRDYPRITGMSGGFITTTGYHIIKVYGEEALKEKYTAVNPAIILRYAEVLLNYAEARAELDELTQDDLDISINLLRDRAGMPPMQMNPPMDSRYANDGVSSEIVEIRRERRVELFMEGHRYNDLRRWKQGKKLEIPDLGIHFDAAAEARYDGHEIQTTEVEGRPYIDVYAGSDWHNPVFDESKHYLWPIPISVMSQNPNIEQNPGW